MRKFKDRLDREWIVEINVSAVRRVERITGINLLKILDKANDGSTLLGRIGSDPLTLIDVLFALVKPDADKAGVDQDSFDRAFSGDVLLDSRNALLEELTLFFPDQRVRNLIASLVRQNEKVADMVATGSMDALESLDIEATANDVLETMRAGLKLRQANGSMPKSGSAPESSDSTQDRSLSDN